MKSPDGSPVYSSVLSKMDLLVQGRGENGADTDG
jgi:hypothetical protein